MKVIEREFFKEIDVSAAVAKWNYWDHEHLAVVHKNYVSAKILFEKNNTVALLLNYRLPVLSFLTSNSLSVFVQTDEDTEMNFNQGLFGIPSETTIRVISLGHDKCRITMHYRFFLRGWRKLLAPVMYRLMAKWNEQVWVEDLPLKWRRQKVLRAGFRDFVGLPEKIKDRHFDGPLEFSLPIARPKESPLNDYMRSSQTQSMGGTKPS